MVYLMLTNGLPGIFNDPFEDESSKYHLELEVKIADPPMGSRMLTNLRHYELTDAEADLLEDIAINGRRGYRVEIDSSTEYKVSKQDIIWVYAKCVAPNKHQWLVISAVPDHVEEEIEIVDDSEDPDDYVIQGVDDE